MTNNLLLLHGALGSKQQFSALKETLKDQFDVYDLDFEGHGESASTKAFAMDLFTDNVIDFLAKHQIEQTNIFGYSMGGYVALNLTKKAPQLVNKIITLGMKFNWTAEVAEKEIRMLNPDKIEEKVPAFANSLKAVHSANDWKAVVRKTADMMYGLGNGEKLTASELSQITNKILIGIGSEDRMVSIEESTDCASHLSNGKLEIIEGFQHPIEKVNVEQLASIIIQFLKTDL